MVRHGTGPDNDNEERIRADMPITVAARALARIEWARVTDDGASAQDRRDAARHARLLLRTFPHAFPSGRARSIRSLARTARLGTTLHPAAADRITDTVTCRPTAPELEHSLDSTTTSRGTALRGTASRGMGGELTARRASRRAIARALRKVQRRGRKLERRSPRAKWLEIVEPLRTAIDLAQLFRDVAAPEIDAFLRHARALEGRFARLAADEAAVPDEEFVAAWRKFRKRRVLRLAVPDL